MLQGPKFYLNKTLQDLDIVDISSDEDDAGTQTRFTTNYIISVLKDLKIGSIGITPSELVNCSEPHLFLQGQRFFFLEKIGPHTISLIYTSWPSTNKDSATGSARTFQPQWSKCVGQQGGTGTLLTWLISGFVHSMLNKFLAYRKLLDQVYFINKSIRFHCSGGPHASGLRLHDAYGGPLRWHIVAMFPNSAAKHRCGMCHNERFGPAWKESGRTGGGLFDLGFITRRFMGATFFPYKYPLYII